MKVYISGQITGLSEEEYRTNFGRAEALMLDLGHEPVNPLKVVACPDQSCGSTETFTDGTYQHAWKCYMKYDILELFDCEAIVLLPNYLGSKGAALEARVAHHIGLPSALIDGEYKGLFMTSGEGW